MNFIEQLKIYLKLNKNVKNHVIIRVFDIDVWNNSSDSLTYIGNYLEN